MTQAFTNDDKRFMREALLFAKKGLGRVAPNPPVGCVIVRDGALVGRGWHDRLGGLHAEAMALADAGDKASGATAYVTLSPCTSHGRQPPCTEALINAGIKKVIVAAPDPNPCNCSGVDVLNARGIWAKAGLLQSEAEYLARGFFKMIRCGLPYITLKYAMTMDGKIASATGDSKWISCPQSREWVHVFRSQVDAVMVGSGTALADDPLLTVRGEAWERCGGSEHHKQPTRVVVDGGFRLPPEAAMLGTGCDEGSKVVIAGIRGKNASGVKRLRVAGAEVHEFDGVGEKVPLEDVLRLLGEMGINHILCEGGAGLAAALLEGGLIDEVVIFIAPKIIGGSDAPGPVGGSGIGKMSEALQLEIREWQHIGSDILIRGEFPSRILNT